MNIRRCYPVVAEVVPNGGVHFRVWAPIRRKLEVVIDNQHPIELSREAGGSFSAWFRKRQRTYATASDDSLIKAASTAILAEYPSPEGRSFLGQAQGSGLASHRDVGRTR